MLSCLVRSSRVLSFCSCFKSRTRNYIEIFERAQQCAVVQNYKSDHRQYSLMSKNDSLSVRCEFLDHLHVLQAQDDGGAVRPATSKDLYIFSGQAGKTTLAGEGGEIVGIEDYWSFVLKQSEHEESAKEVTVLSIGGGPGYDARAIVNVFHKAGWRVGAPVVVDPHPLIRFCAKQDIRHYSKDSDSFFSSDFEQIMGIRIIHMGTFLTVLPSPKVAWQTLQNITSQMRDGDVLSILMVSSEQFQGHAYKLDPKSDENGLAIVRKTSDGEPYKIVISEAKKFNEIMKTLGLKGKMEKYKSDGTGAGGLCVSFLTYKAIKGIDLSLY